MMPQTVSGTITEASLPWPKPFLSAGNIGSSTSTIASFPISRKRVSGNRPTKTGHSIRTRRGAGSIKAASELTAAKEEKQVKVTVQVMPAGGSRGFGDYIWDWFAKSVRLELVAAKLDAYGNHKPGLNAFARNGNYRSDGVEYEAEFTIPDDFGEIGAIRVQHEHSEEMFVSVIVINSDDGSLHIPFSCKSWVEPNDNRIFFTSKSYLPSQTPNGLKAYRESELRDVRGNGMGTRQMNERIYDYDVYNDLGDPEKGEDFSRPVLGGSTNPYPRRCRTGRPTMRNEPVSESRSSMIYVPRDEAFSDKKNAQFRNSALLAFVHRIVPLLEGGIQDRDRGFPSFTAIDSLYNEAIHFPDIHDSLKDIIPNIIKAIGDSGNLFMQFDTPEFVDRDKFAWMRDEEFARQTLAGINPCCIELVKEWPLKSELDPEVYGDPKSAITIQTIEDQIKPFMTFDEALKHKKLFMLDYHDIFLRYVERVRKLKETKLYGSRTLFFLKPDETLMPIAIELTCPPMEGRLQWKGVFTPSSSATDEWLWRIARAHVLAHDSGVHQLVSHWLRTHCSTEPYIIAAHRQLSEMHPIYRLLHPHFRYTMEINASARGNLINAGGVIEKTFSPLRYSMELSSAFYDKHWQFDLQALPADLISRGMAERDPHASYGLKLAIKDYPFANDGLILWDILKNWVTDYVTHYYPEPESVKSDEELQAWWTEIKTVGHGDKKDGWPHLITPDDLIGILTTIIWVASGFHAAVNFGQYDFAGYIPNRPTIARTTMPTEYPTPERCKQFLARPEIELLSCFPTQAQAVVVMGVLNILSTHSPDEEYLIGSDGELAWKVDPIINDAFEVFQKRLKELEQTILEKNARHKTLKNRSGAGLVPYELLKPSSKEGVTSQGIPYSISI